MSIDDHPISHMRWVPIEHVISNDYNPNKVAYIEMGLLATSIRHDGYTQPVVTVQDDTDPDNPRWVIVDGFHRYWTMRSNPDILESTDGLLPIVVLDKPMAERMASTIRHNRARGKHTVRGMSEMVFSMLEEGMTDEEVCQELGMEPEELLRLKHLTGFAKLFENTEYQKAWMTTRQARIRAKYQATHADGLEIR